MSSYVHITNRDFDILVMFCEHPKQLVPRGSLAARSDGKAPTAIVRLIVASPAPAEIGSQFAIAAAD